MEKDFMCRPAIECFMPPPGLRIYSADGDWRTETGNLARSLAA
jgi:hypothetical protein